MQINLISCLFVLDSEKNDNIRKNDIKKIKVLVSNREELPSVIFNGNGMKKQIRKDITSIIGSDIFHLEQVFTMDYKDSIDIIYLGITNIENVKKIKKEYQLIDFKIENNHTIIYGDSTYQYQSIEIEKNGNIEYIHKIETKDEKIKRNLLNLLISYKRIRSSIDNTDIMFKFMGSSFTLEDVRILYEIIKDTSVDKSNFRKKIMKYCEKIDEKEETKNGFRPSQKYKFKLLKGDSWLWLLQPITKEN